MNKNIRFPQKEKQPKKLIRAMKFFLLFALLTTGSCFASETYSQEASFSMNYENKTIKEIINEIENNSEFIFFYLDKSIDLNRKVSINVKEQKIETILDQLFSNTENNYSISDRQIIISKKETPVNTKTNKSRKTKSDGREKRKAIFEAKTKCAQKSRLLPPSGQNTSVVQTPFKSCLNDAFLLNFLLKYHLKPIANLAKNRIFT